VLARQPGELRDPRLDRQPARAVAADVRLHRHRSGEKTTWRRRCPRPALPDGARASRVRGYPKTTGKRGIQIWIPIVPATASTRRAVGRARLAGPSVDRAGARLLGVGDKARQGRPGSTTPRTRASRRSSRRTRSDPRPGARSRRRSPGTSWTIRACDPTAGRSARSWHGWPQSATCSPRPRATSRSATV
jgi:hypothetical protein